MSSIEPCDRCPSKDMVWCQSNGCSTEEDIKYIEEEFFVKEEEEERKLDLCDCGEKLLICDSGMRLCSVGCKDRWVNSKGEEIFDDSEEEEKWDIRPAGDFPECAYCENICKIITVDTCRKFSTNCGKCPNSIEK